MMTDDFPDGPMVAILTRGLRGDERHKYTAERLRERNPEAYESLLARARQEVAEEATPEAEQIEARSRQWHFCRWRPPSAFTNIRVWLFHLWNEFDLWKLRDNEVELQGVRLFGFEFEKS